MLKREKPHPHQRAHTRSTHDERMKPASEKASSNSVYAGLVGTISFSADFEPTTAHLPVRRLVYLSKITRLPSLQANLS